MNQKHVLDLIHDYIDGLLNEDQIKSFKEHIGQCDSCRKEFDSIRTLVEKLKSLPKSVRPPADIFTGIESKLEQTELGSLEIDHRRNGKVEKKILRFFDYFNPNKVQAAWYFRAAAMVTVLVGAFAVWFTLKAPLSQLDISEIITQPTTKVESTEKQFDALDKSKRTESPSIIKKEAPSKFRENRISEPERPNLTADNSHTQTKRTDIQKPLVAENLMAMAKPDSIVAKIDSTQKSMYQITQLEKGSNKIVGRATDAISGDPIVGANIVVVGTRHGAITDFDGIFTIIGIPPGTYTLRAAQVGYTALEMKDVRIDNKESTPLDFKMTASAVQISGVTITADQALVNSLSTSSTQTTSEKSIPSIPNVKSVEDVSKLQAAGTKQGNNLFLRGGRSNEVQYFVNGVPVSQPDRLQSAQRPFNTEGYDKINENEFLDVRQNPLSTFSIDVDNASYSNVRQFIQNGQLPPKDAVRIEELINYFTYDYPQPRDRHPFSITTEMSTCPWNDEHKLLLIGLQGKKIATENLPPSNLVFLLDVSGSMNEPNKLPLVKAAFRLLVDQLREEDKVSIVVYAGRAGLVLPSTYGDDKEEILHAIDQLQAGGSTAGGEGILLAYRIAQENFKKNGNNRVILATDGDFNVGVSSDSELERLIEEKRNSGIYLSVLGFGTGNYKDSKMEKLADKGNGNYSYIDNLQEARKVFVGQMAGTLFTIAKDVKLQIEFNPAKVKAYRLIGYENRMLAKEDFNNDKKDAGDIGAGHSVTALYEIIPSGGETDLPEVDDLKYQVSRVNRNAKTSNEILTVKFRYKPPKESESRLIVHPLEDETTELDETSNNFRWAASVVEFGILLRDSQFKGNASFRNVIEIAHDAKGKDREGYRAEFIRLVELCKDLVRSER
ncbi:MAG: von Willebrand factor type A domain-containing protein [Ignavibacteriales bacterium]|nr:von Willebrand factor type A domain-containing protein [Ignavibacteriales bacterium]